MAASIVEVASGVRNSNDYNATITTTPQAGDVIVAIRSYLSNRQVVSVSGLGGTWTRQATYPGFATSQYSTHDVWYTTNATTAGVVTATLDGGSGGELWVVVIRGASPAVVSQTAEATNVFPFAGPSHTAGDGQVVLTAATDWSPPTPRPDGPPSAPPLIACSAASRSRQRHTR